MPKDNQIDAPMTLVGLFPDESDDENEMSNDDVLPIDKLESCYEIQSVVIGDKTLQIRQYDFHSHNANRVWPGTFNLADYLLQIDEITNSFLHKWGNILELGTATGLLAIRLCSVSSVHDNDRKGESNPEKVRISYCCDRIVTSDVDDEHGEVAKNLMFNYELNSISSNAPLHIPHTWGTGWMESVAKRIPKTCTFDIKNAPWKNICILGQFDTIIASDILLYVSAYAALVQTLVELFEQNNDAVFVMSWNRRMKESSEFFDRMVEAGFDWEHQGKCVYRFVLKKKNE